MKKLVFLAVLLGALSLMTACSGGVGGAAATDETAQLNDPRVGDLYAAELSELAEFQVPGEKAYGLLKVIKVEADTVTIVTDSSAWDDTISAKRELRGDLKEVVWDTDDEIVLARSQLLDMRRKDVIFGVRRGG
jgi:ABC-type glycerol-3-phosphate transport system substrate-binding protein